ncbi:MAG: hypothetical protein ACP5D3_02980 [Sulfurovum sp.]
MEIVETSVYTEDIVKILSDEEYQELQKFLVTHPKSEDLTPKQIDILRKTFFGDQ